MKDLELWNRLRAGLAPPADAPPAHADPSRLADLLDDLGRASLADRLPFLGLLGAALEDPAPEVRAAAARSLAGAVGFPALKAVVRSLNDPEEAVRRSAAAALGETAANDPARWAHGLFHRHPDVRLAALAHPPGKRLPWYALLALTDARCGEAMGADLPDDVPPIGVFALLDLMRRGALSREAVATRVAAMAIEALFNVVSHTAGRRGDVEVGRVIDTAAGRAAGRRPAAVVDALNAEPSRDGIDPIVELFWDESRPADDPALPARPPTAPASPGGDFFQKLTVWATASGRPHARRVTASVLKAAAGKPGWDPLAARVALLLCPEFLGFKWVPAPIRRAAVAVLYEFTGRVAPLDAATVRKLIVSPECRTEDGRIDLWVVGGVLRWAPGEPYKLAESELGAGQIAAAFQADPERSAPFFSLPSDPEGRRRLIDAITGRARHARGSFLAGLVLVCPADEMSFLDDLDGAGAVSVYETLLGMAARPGASLSDNKLRRLAGTLAEKVAPEYLGAFLRATADAPDADANPVAQRVLAAVARLAGAEKTTAAVRRLDVPRLKRLLGVIPACPGFPWGSEVHLASALAGHKDEDVRNWTTTRRGASGPPGAPDPVATPGGATARALTEAEADRIATAAPIELAAAVEPCLRECVTGLTEALRRRPSPGLLSLAACAALLGSHDPPELAAREFARWSSEEPDFLSRLDAMAVKHWAWNRSMPLLGCCWLHLWDDQCLAAGEALSHFGGGLAGALRWAAALPAVALGRQVHEAVARLLAIWRRRDKARLAALDFAPLCERLAAALGGPFGLPAARALVTIHESAAAAEVMKALQPHVIARLADLSAEEREALRDWADSRGLATQAAPRRAPAPAAEPALLKRIAESEDPDELEGFCRDGGSNGNDPGCGAFHPQVVQEATLRLLERGESGAARLAALLTGAAPDRSAAVIAESLPLWPAGPALERVRAFFPAAPGSSELLFFTGCNLLEAGQRDAAAAAADRDRPVRDGLLEVCRRPAEPAWFRQEHWKRLLASGFAPLDAAVALAASPQPYAYQNAVRTLLDAKDADGRAVRAVAAFLESDSERLMPLRIEAAEWLRGCGDFTGFPLLLRQALTPPRDRKPAAYPDLLAGAPPELVGAAVRAALYAGHAHEGLLINLLDRDGVPAGPREDGYRLLVKDASLGRTRAHAVAQVRTGGGREAKLDRLARTFAWGVLTGRELTGRVFGVEMESGKGLGHTRFDAEKIWVSPLPILRGQRNAEAVTRGLIVHEFGHHLYHNNPGDAAVWDAADKAGFHGLLNLVSDEHLERRLRASDRAFGDDLKKLASFAFQHTEREVPLDSLLACLGARAFDVLTACPLAAARRRGCLAVNNGAVLAEMERAGLSFARFVRALRMGLGDRHGDPKVAAALALFKGRFRHHGLEGLRDVSLKLREIFGWETSLAESFAQDAILSADGDDLLAEGEGITAGELRDAVSRLLDDRRRGRSKKEGTPIRQINTGPEESFELIRTVEPVPFVPEKHMEYAAQVAGPARKMRSYFEKLGLHLRDQRMRLRGRRLDRGRILPAVVRGDPRMLVARELEREADLFLGLLIDCSGSMAMHRRIDQGKLFGTLLAEAARGMPGIDVRVFGFTDRVIYDAGDADRCAAHSLEASGGNNDAAALWHAACLARASRRKAKLLVMISDGAPTECTVTALSALVRRLTGPMRICCAQVAVCPIETRCFPDYIELQSQNLPESVRRFGQVVAKLVQKAVSS